jgi:hypothetical protein
MDVKFAMRRGQGKSLLNMQIIMNSRFYLIHKYPVGGRRMFPCAQINPTLNRLADTGFGLADHRVNPKKLFRALLSKKRQHRLPAQAKNSAAPTCIADKSLRISERRELGQS